MGSDIDVTYMSCVLPKWGCILRWLADAVLSPQSVIAMGERRQRTDLNGSLPGQTKLRFHVDVGGNCCSGRSRKFRSCSTPHEAEEPFALTELRTSTQPHIHREETTGRNSEDSGPRDCRHLGL